MVYREEPVPDALTMFKPSWGWVLTSATILMPFGVIMTPGASSMSQWLTLDEAGLELGLGVKAVRTMLRHGLLVGYQVPGSQSRRKKGAWRILNPGAKFARYLEESKRRCEHVPLLSGREVAEILGVRPSAIRQLKKRHRIEGKLVGRTTVYSVEAVRHLLKQRERKIASDRKLYSPTLATWARGLVSQDSSLQAQALDEMFRQLVRVPEPAKSRYILELWQLFDAVNSLLRSASLKRDHPPPGTRKLVELDSANQNVKPEGGPTVL